jgi:hypothetical protein
VEDLEDFWFHRPDPTEEDIVALARAWVTYQAEHEPRQTDPPQKPALSQNRRYEAAYVDQDEDPLWWAVEAVMGVDRLPLLWRVIQTLCSVAELDQDWVVAMIGTGPVEHAFFEYGLKAMDLIEPAAERDPVLLMALESVRCWDEPVRPRIDALLLRHGLSDRPRAR